MTCSTCSLWRKCSLYREGSVCTVGGTNGRRLAEQFRSRNAAEVGEGLRRLVEMQAELVDDEHAQFVAINEKVEATDDPEDAPDPVEMERRRTSLMRNMNSVFGNAAKLYALDRPTSPQVQVNVGMVGPGSAPVDPQRDDARTLASKAMAELEAKGVDPTDEAIQAQIASYSRQAESEVIEGEWS